MISFLSLLRSKKLPFSVDIFRSLFYIREMLDGTLSVGARVHRKLILRVPQKFCYWHERFLFVKVPNDYPLPSYLENLWKEHSELPELSEEEDDCVRSLFDAPPGERDFQKLTSSNALKRSNLIDPLGVFLFSFNAQNFYFYELS